jgi:hypothetical protein
MTRKVIRALLIAGSLIAIVANWPAISVGAEKLAHKFLFVGLEESEARLLQMWVDSTIPKNSCSG